MFRGQKLQGNVLQGTFFIHTHRYSYLFGTQLGNEWIIQHTNYKGVRKKTPFIKYKAS